MSPDTKITSAAAAEFRTQATEAAKRGIVVIKTVSPEFAALLTAIPAETLLHIGVATLPTADSQVELIYSRDIFPFLEEAVRLGLESKDASELKIKAELYKAIYSLVQQYINTPITSKQFLATAWGKLLLAAGKSDETLGRIFPDENPVITDQDLKILQALAVGYYQDVTSSTSLLDDWVNDGRTPENMFTKADN